MRLLLGALLAAMFSATAFSDVYYVDGANGSDTEGDGSQDAPWATIQFAVDTVEGLRGNNAEILIAGGVYTSQGEAVVELDIYEFLDGGYNPSGWTRDAQNYPTVIDGEYTRRCVTGAGSNDLSGLTLRNGFAAKDDQGYYGFGGGLYVEFGSTTVNNCRFENNSAERYGGAIYNSGARLTITDCVFQENMGLGTGGAVSFGESAKMTIQNTVFSGNEAPTGGALEGNPGQTLRILDCDFTGNTSEFQGGALSIGYYAFPATEVYIEGCVFQENALSGSSRYGGGISASGSGIDLRVSNCVFNGNTGDFGGGIYAWNGAILTVERCDFRNNSAAFGAGLRFDSLGSARIDNCAFWNNESAGQGGALFGGSEYYLTNCSFANNVSSGRSGGAIANYGADTVGHIVNCAFNGNSPDDQTTFQGATMDSTYSCWSGFWPQEGCIAADPLFLDADNGDLRLRSNSPCIDAGIALAGDETPTDYWGIQRPQRSGWDIGAFEYPEAFTGAIENISRPGYETGALDAGELVYVDRAYEFTTPIPGDLLWQTYIRTLNDDKDATGYGFFQFDVDQPVTIVIAHDARYPSPPAWLRFWEKRDDTLTTTDTFGPERNLYQRDFPSGHIVLGANRDPGMPENLSMYSVVVLPRDPGPAGAGEHWPKFK
jgi:predicted outer membrane repeat protein